MLRLNPFLQSTRKLFQCTPLIPLVPLAVGIPATKPVEEECVPRYNPRHFYPVRLYEILHDRYQVVAKLGWGTSSTVWLAQDLYQWRWLPRRYVTIKIMEHITKTNSEHVGRNFVRTLLDSFELCGPYGTHICLVFSTLREPLWILKQRFQNDVIQSDVLKILVKLMLEGLDYLHNVCHIIHTDLKTDNILLRLRDESVLETLALDELEHPLPQKVLDDRTIYLSRNDFGLGVLVITDFGLAVRGDVSQPHYRVIQPDHYRAPEVILATGWSYSADIWNLAILLWDLLEEDGIFDPLNSQKMEYTSEKHLAHMIALLGTPPKELLDRGKETARYFDDKGEFRYPELIPERLSLADSLRQVEGEEKILFHNFIMRMLRWMPEERSTTRELLVDPWLEANQ